MQTIKQLLFFIKDKISEFVEKIDSSNNWIRIQNHTCTSRLDQTTYPLVHLST